MPTPGLKFLASLSLPLGGNVLLVLGLEKLSTHLELDLPTWSIVLFGTLAGPLLITTRILSKRYRDYRSAKALGARLAPTLRGRKLGNFDFVEEQIKLLETSGYPGDGLIEMFEKYGPVVNLRILWSDAVITTCPEHIKLILATDFANYVKGPEFDYEMSSVLGSGVFNSDGEMWKFHRNLTRPHFSREKITDFDLFDRHVNAAIGKLKERIAAGYAVDVQDLLHRFTMDTATEFLFGKCVHTLDSSLPYPPGVAPPSSWSSSQAGTRSTVDPMEFAKAFQAAQYTISLRERRGWIWPLYEITQDATAGPMKIVNAFVEPLVKQAVEKRKALVEQGKVNDGEEMEGETVLDHLVKMTSDPKLLKDETINILVAGRDTTAATLTFILHFLTMYPAVTARLRDEILAKVGPNGRPTFNDIKDMKYLRAVINETLRLYPVVPFNVRTTIEARVWPSPDPTQKPIYIPAGTRTPYSVFLMQRRTDLWGPDAEEFDPDRWLDSRLEKHVLKNHFAFLPFNAGPRICLGQQFAYNEMSFTLIKLLQNFSSFDFAPDATPREAWRPASWNGAPGRKGIDQLRPKSHLTMYTDGGLWLRLTEASKAQ